MVWTFMKERGLKTAFGGKVSVETPCKADPNSKSKPGLRKPWQHLSKQWCEFQKKNQKNCMNLFSAWNQPFKKHQKTTGIETKKRHPKPVWQFHLPPFSSKDHHGPPRAHVWRLLLHVSATSPRDSRAQHWHPSTLTIPALTCCSRKKTLKDLKGHVQ